MTEGGEPAQLIKYLPYKQEDPSLAPRIHVKNKKILTWIHMFAIPALEMLRHVDSLGSLDSQPSPYLVNSRKVTDSVSRKTKVHGTRRTTQGRPIVSTGIPFLTLPMQ